MKVGELASRAGVNVETLRYYERRGLLPPPRRLPSGHRAYDEETVRLLVAIKDAQAVGFTLSEIKEYFATARRPGSRPEALRVRMAAKIDEIDSRIAQLRRMRDELARVVGCSCQSLDHCTCGAVYLARHGREPATRPDLLHVTNGESAGNTLRQTALGGAVLSWSDALHEGPVPAGPRSELLRIRAGFLSERGWGSRAAIHASLERRDRQFLEALRTGTRVVLWFEHDLYDQLQLLDSLALAHEAGAASPELIVIGSFPGHRGFRGLGELTAPELETLWPTRRPAAPDVLATAVAAWAAFRAPEPVALAQLAAEESSPMPFLGMALRRLLEELPAPGTGLSGSERRALEVIAGGAATPGAAFVAAQGLEDAPFQGDTTFYSTLGSLSGLIETEEAAALPPPPPLGDGRAFTSLRLRLTRDGERVLRGELDRVVLLGIDRWVGGTHLTPQNLWRWDPAARELSYEGSRPQSPP